jgi:hypothetical protein
MFFRTKKSGSRCYLQIVENRWEDGREFEWADVIQDLDRLQVVDVEQDGKRFRLRTEVRGCCARVFQAARVALPPLVEQLE